MTTVFIAGTGSFGLFRFGAAPVDVGLAQGVTPRRMIAACSGWLVVHRLAHKWLSLHKVCYSCQVRALSSTQFTDGRMCVGRRSFTDVFQRLLHRIVAKPAVYDFVQRVCGEEHSHRRLRALTVDARDCLVLDVGAGTGNGLDVIPEGVRYLWLDNDRQKLTGVGQRGSCFSAVLASATAIPLASKSVDIALCIAMSHHIDDVGILDLFGELARVCRERLIFLDPVLNPKSLVSRVLWKYDRGSHPRSAAALRSLVHERFEITHDEEYTLYHRYWLCAAKPRL